MYCILRRHMTPKYFKAFNHSIFKAKYTKLPEPRIENSFSSTVSPFN